LSDSTPSQTFDLIVRGGTVYDGSGGEPFVADVAVAGDRIARIGTLDSARAGTVIDAAGMAVAPGFVNMLSHSYFSMLQDGRSLSELKQGVTTQIFGEGASMGPLTPDMRQRMRDGQREAPVDVPWLSLAEYLAHAEKHGISQNIASYIGATTLRIYAVGPDDRPATAAELDVMRGLVADGMSAGALGIGSSLIYPPAFFASTEELIALCAAAAPYRGKYISHMRNESHGLLDAIGELMRIGREAGVPAEIYHLKAAGQANWRLMDAAIEQIEQARASGARITADMYTYAASSTGLSAAIPPRYQDGGPRKLLERLEDAAVRAEIKAMIEGDDLSWSNLYRECGGADGVLIAGVRREENRRYQGKRLSEVAGMMGIAHPIDAMLALIRHDRSRVETVYFSMSEENVSKQIRLPWVSFGSDGSSVAAEGHFLKTSPHPRVYGNFARLLGKYVRDERAITLAEAVRRLARLPADNLELDHRGRIEEGYYADVVVFDPATVADRATFEEPHQYAAGVRDVIVNGRAALRDGEFSGELPGRALYGPGKTG
jgi:N-acyl-D-amino-acid deacylase